MNHSKRLGQGKISTLLWEFSLPSIISTIANSLYTIIDRAFVGRLVGGLAISGMTLTFPISLIIMAFGMLVGVGASTLISLRLGEGKKSEAEKILGNAFSLILLVSCFLTIVGLLFLEPILESFGASKQVLPYAKDFISIILLGTIMQITAFSLSAMIRAEGNPRKSMYILLLNAGLNIILDAIFVYLLGLGIKGTAIATVISQTVSALWAISHFLLGKDNLLKLSLKNMSLEKNIFLAIFSIGMAPFAMQLASSVVNVLINQQLKIYGGDLAIGALGIMSSVAIFLIMPVLGLTQGAQPIIGFNYGAEKYDRVKQTLKLSIIIATFISCLGFFLVQLFPVPIMSFFTKDPKLIQIGEKGMTIYLLMMPVIGFQIVSSQFFQAIGKAQKSLFLTLSRQVIILIPLLFILPPIFKLNGIWLTSPISDLLSSLLTATFFFAELKKLNKKIQIKKSP